MEKDRPNQEPRHPAEVCPVDCDGLVSYTGSAVENS